jgi:hypothetical protein
MSPRRTHSTSPTVTVTFLIALTSFIVLPSCSWSQAHKATAERNPMAASPVITPYNVSQSIPLSFETNQGQADPAVKFISRGGGYSLFLTSTEAVLALRSSGDRGIESDDVLRMKIVGANPHREPQITGQAELPGKVNYFLGNDPRKWRTNVSTYAKVKYEGVYPGVDLIYYGTQRQLEYDFVLEPGADPNQIHLGFDGAREIRIDEAGDLVLSTKGGEVRQQKPVVYQEVDGSRKEIAGSYVVKGNREVGFTIGSYDMSRPLVIDPVLIYSTYFGGNNVETAHGIAVDAAGNAYVTGFTNSTDFPTASPLQLNFRGTNDAFVAKLNATGTAWIYTTYLGGSGNDHGLDIAVDAEGNAYVTGLTTGNFPTVNPLQGNSRGGFDAFVAKLNATGSALVYSTHLGGSRDEGGFDFNQDIAVDGEGNVYVTGRTNSTDFPIASPLQPTNRGGYDAFVAKINSAGSALVYSTYLGGSRDDMGYGIALNTAGNAYVMGATFSPDFPTANPLDSTLAGTFDAFVAKLDTMGTALDYSTYLGGSDQEGGFGGDIAVDAAGFAYVTGSTGSTDFPTVNPLQSTKRGSHDVFVVKLNPDATTVIFSTYLGGSGTDAATSIAIDDTGIYVTGFSSGADFPVVNPLDGTRGGSSDAIVAKLSSTGSEVIYATYFGGDSQETGNAIAVDAAGNAYLTGRTNSINLQTANPLQPVLRGNQDGFIARIFNAAIFSVEAIVANRGGNSGDVSVSVLGEGFQPGAAVKLTAAGQPDIDSVNPTVIGSSRMSATFSLRGATPGLRDLVVTLPDGSEATLHGGFTIEQDGAADLWVDLVGRDRVRVGRQETFKIVYGNHGNINAYGVMLWVAGIPSDAVVKLGLELTPPSLQPGENQIDWRDVPALVEANGQKILALLIPVIQPGTNVLSVSITVPAQQPFQLQAWMNRPLFKRRPGSSPASAQLSLGSSAVQESGEESSAEPALLDLVSCLGQIGGAVMRFPEGYDCIYQLLAFDLEVLMLQYESHLGLALDLTSANWEFGQIFVQCSEFTGDLRAKAFEFMVDVANVALAVGSEECNRTFSRITKSALAIRPVTAYDPNDKVGAHGVGGPRYVSGEEPLRYIVFFENLATATAAAQEVRVTDQLDTSKLDLATFAVGPITFGNKHVTPPSSLSHFTTDVDLRPENDLLVNIDARLNKETGLVTWKFTSIDPATGFPTEDPLAGFLPPNVNPPDGEGSVFFTVMPKQGLLTGTEVRNEASIVFDTNPAIQTPTWLNTLDNSVPISEVHSLTAAPCSANLNVQWSGEDSGSGIRDYTIYVSEDGGPFTIWQSNTTATSGTYAGQFDHAYAFYSVAEDETSNIEDSPVNPDATVTPTTPTPPTFTSVPPAITAHSGQGTACQAFVSDAALGTASAQDACSGALSVMRSGVPEGNIFPVGTTTITYTATDVVGNTTRATQVITVLDAQAPTILLAGETITLWPANHRYETASLAQLVASASDDCGGNVSENVVIAQVSSDEPEDAQGGGDGNTLNDIVIAPDCKSVQLRAERQESGNGRVYTITFRVRDTAGNTATATAKVRVPKSQNQNPAVDGGPSYTVMGSCPG